MNIFNEPHLFHFNLLYILYGISCQNRPPFPVIAKAEAKAGGRRGRERESRLFVGESPKRQQLQERKEKEKENEGQKKKKKHSISSSSTTVQKKKKEQKWSPSDLQGKKRIFNKAFSQILKSASVVGDDNNKKEENRKEEKSPLLINPSSSSSSTLFKKGELFVCLRGVKIPFGSNTHCML